MGIRAADLYEKSATCRKRLSPRFVRPSLGPLELVLVRARRGAAVRGMSAPLADAGAPRFTASRRHGKPRLGRGCAHPAAGSAPRTAWPRWASSSPSDDAERVPGEGLEPPRPQGQPGLSRPRLPVTPPGPDPARYRVEWSWSHRNRSAGAVFCDPGTGGPENAWKSQPSSTGPPSAARRRSCGSRATSASSR